MGALQTVIGMAGDPGRNNARPSLIEDASRALERAVSEYLPEPYGGNALLFRAGRPPARYRDLQNGWAGLIDKLEIQNIPGGHIDLLLEPGVQTVADTLASRLIAATSTGFEDSPAATQRSAARYAVGF